MTFKEKLQQEHPNYVGERYEGGCRLCPYIYGYESRENLLSVCRKRKGKCEACWDREIPETEGTEKMKVTYDEIPANYSHGCKKRPEYAAIKQFLKSEHISIRFSYDSADEARRRRQSLAATISREGLPIHSVVRKNNLYFIKEKRTAEAATPDGSENK